MALSDLKLAAYLPLLLAWAWLAPERTWRSFARHVTSLPRPIALYPPQADDDLWPGRATAAERSTNRVQRNLQYLRDLGPGRWQPEIVISNAKVLDEAVARGRGAVLWIADTRCAGLIAKKALHRLGFNLHHLSRPEHGLSPTEFGVRYLNAITRTVENRYLEDRIRVDDGSEFAAAKRLRAVLAEGGVVSITATKQGQQVRDVAIAGGLLSLASGAAALAHGTGAALIPVFCLEEADGSYRVLLDPAIDARNDTHRAAAIKAMMLEFAGRHETKLDLLGSQWRGYGSLREFSDCRDKPNCPTARRETA